MGALPMDFHLMVPLLLLLLHHQWQRYHYFEKQNRCWWRTHPSGVVSIRSRPQAILLLLVSVLLLFIIVIISFGLLVPLGLFFNALDHIQHQSAVLASSPYTDYVVFPRTSTIHEEVNSEQRRRYHRFRTSNGVSHIVIL
jgi:hypothetical protein